MGFWWLTHAKFHCQNVCTLPANFLRLKNWICQLFGFLDVCFWETFSLDQLWPLSIGKSSKIFGKKMLLFVTYDFLWSNILGNNSHINKTGVAQDSNWISKKRDLTPQPRIQGSLSLLLLLIGKQLSMAVHLDKYILPFGQIHLAICANTFCYYWQL